MRSGELLKFQLHLTFSTPALRRCFWGSRGQTLRNPHKFTLSSALDGAPHHAEPAPIFPSILVLQNLCRIASIPGLVATMRALQFRDARP